MTSATFEIAYPRRLLKRRPRRPVATRRVLYTLAVLGAAVVLKVLLGGVP